LDIARNHVERFVRRKPAFFFNPGVGVLKEILRAVVADDLDFE
jgi:hypothetical protein